MPGAREAGCVWIDVLDPLLLDGPHGWSLGWLESAREGEEPRADHVGG